MSLEIQFGKPLNAKFAPYVMGIKDDINNALEITVALAKSVKAAPITVNGKVIDVHSEILPDEENVFRIVFQDYLIYQVRDESFSNYNKMERRQGDFFCLVENSQILNEIGSLTIAQRFDDDTYFPGEWKHYAIMSQNHVIDIISTSKPDVVQLDSGDKSSELTVLKAEEHELFVNELFEKKSLAALIYLIDNGRELEFKAHGKECFISCSGSKKYVSIWESQEEQSFHSVYDLIKNATIEKVDFLEAWEQAELTYLF